MIPLVETKQSRLGLIKRPSVLSSKHSFSSSGMIVANKTQNNIFFLKIKNPVTKILSENFNHKVGDTLISHKSCLTDHQKRPIF